MFIGFIGTPLLKSDKATSIETFGSFIHTYKFDEAVRDGAVCWTCGMRRATLTST
jgi:type I restriction enzyme R subunit